MSVTDYIKPIRIGDVELPGNIFASPCAGFTDWPERLLFKRFGAHLCCTEFVSIEGMIRGNERTLEMLSRKDEEKPVAAQIYGDIPEHVPEAAQMVQDLGYDILDINMGCPAKKVCRHGSGSALMKDHERAVAMTRNAVNAVNIPVTVKMRTGFFNDDRNAVELAKKLQDVGAQMITVHGRTAQQGYRGEADWSYIAKVKEAVDVPLIGNGDVIGAKSAKRLFEISGCDGIMIGRGSIGNPWIFEDIILGREENEGMPGPHRPRFKETLLQHLTWMEERYGEDYAYILFRKHAVKYVKGAPGASKFKEAICHAPSGDAIREILSTAQAA